MLQPFSSRGFHWWRTGRVRTFEEDAESRCSTFGFCYAPPPKQRKTSEARNALATHRDVINELLSAGPSNQQKEFEPEPRTKDVAIQCGKYFTVCAHAVAICCKGECSI